MRKKLKKIFIGCAIGASVAFGIIIAIATDSANRGDTSKPQTKEANENEDNQKDVLMKAAKLKTTMNYYNYGGSILETPIGNLQECTIICLTGNEYYVDDPNNGRRIKYGEFYTFFEPNKKGAIAIEEEKLANGSIETYMSEIQDVTQEIHSATLNKDVVYTTRVGDNIDVQLTQGLTVYPIGEGMAIVKLGEQQEIVWLNKDDYNYDKVAIATLDNGTRITIPTSREKFKNSFIVNNISQKEVGQYTIAKGTEQDRV